ncbi:MAG: uroporphyrinogen-III C-methyltransferase [Dehalococcoidia bacterium]|nr:uroporphyrinogen-III C-methyltransferase [Dehalococcoidia bacterium]
MKEGKVYLVGAGPGDPGLITVKAAECLRRADVVVYDHLADEQLLELASPGAERIYAGKTATEHAREQDEINQLLVTRAKEGKTVVRLKGGDPFVLGRGGEEAEALAKNGIPFEIVPGISSAIAVPAYAGIPVTHRGVASSFAVITGHEDPGKESSSINWHKLATGVDTLVFLMGMQNLPKIRAQLVEHGRPADTPVAVIKEGTKPEQRTITGTLGNIVAKVKEAGLSAPAIIVVGEVVKLRDKIRWFDNRPLFGKRVLVTRARHQASVLSRLLAERGAEPIELPSIEIRPVDDTSELDRAVLNLGSYHWLLFTSVNGVDAFFNRLGKLGLDARAFCGINIGAIGSATAEALETRGIRADYVPEVFTSDGIIAGLKSYDVKGKRFLLPRADIADKELVQGLTGLGAEVREIASYRTVPAKDTASRVKELLQAGQIDVITFTSSSTVSRLMAALGKPKPDLGGTVITCIGPKTAQTAAGYGLKVDILAKEHTIPGLVTAIEEYFSKQK